MPPQTVVVWEGGSLTCKWGQEASNVGSSSSGSKSGFSLGGSVRNRLDDICATMDRRDVTIVTPQNSRFEQHY